MRSGAFVMLVAVGSSCCRLGYDAASQQADSGSEVDAAQGCATSVDPATVALYQFEGTASLLSDETGDHPATLTGVPNYVTGQPGCGNALLFDGTSMDYGVIDHSPAWDLMTGSVDLWMRPDAPGCAASAGGWPCCT